MTDSKTRGSWRGRRRTLAWLGAVVAASCTAAGIGWHYARRAPDDSPCANSTANARAIAVRIATQVVELRHRLPVIAALDPAEAVHIPSLGEIEEGKSVEGDGPVIGSVVYSRGAHRDTSHCTGRTLCAARQRFDDGGVYLWVDFYVPPNLSQVGRDTIDIGPLQLFVEVDGADADAVGELHDAVAQVVAAEQRAYETTCGR